MIWPVIALILSLVAPGSGQILNGHYGKGAAFAFIFIFGRYVILPFLLRFLSYKDDVKNLKLIYFFNIIYPVIIIISAVDAVYHSIFMPHAPVMIIYGVIAAAVISSMYKGMGSHLIVYSMCGREDLTKYILPRKKQEEKDTGVKQ